MTPIEEATSTQRKLWREHRKRMARLSPTKPPPESQSKWRQVWRRQPPLTPPKWLTTPFGFRIDSSLREAVNTVRLSHVIAPAVVIRRTVAHSFGLREEDLQGPSRTVKPTLARHVAIYLCKQLLPTASLHQIGTRFGRRDHTTVLHATARIARLIESNTELREHVARLRDQLSEQLNAARV